MPNIAAALKEEIARVSCSDGIKHREHPLERRPIQDAA